MQTSRTVNTIEAELASGGDAFFFLPTLGHESSAAWNIFLQPTDWLFMHYRNKALWLARGVQPKAFFDSILCNADNYSKGRQMCCFPASREANMPNPVVPVGNAVTHAVGCADQLVRDAKRQGTPGHAAAEAGGPVVFCSMGDGTTQQGEVYEGIMEAVRRKLPVLFVIEDNGYAISTPTAGNTFFNLPAGPADEFLGLPIHRFDGRDVMDHLPAMGELVKQVRTSGGPGLCVIRHDRLSSHTNADDHRVYRSAETIQKLLDESDPVANFRRSLIRRGVDEAELDAIDAEIEKQCRHASELSRRVGDAVTTDTAKCELPDHLQTTAGEYTGKNNTGVQASAHMASKNGSTKDTQPLLMIEAMRNVLRHRLDTDPRVFLTGEDIEDPKGDVFGVTRGLSTDFPDRVVNAALSEPTIIGGNIGRAFAGGFPVGFIQFADFLPNGISQIMSELGSIYWRTDGMFSCPSILMVTCGGYRPGLGPFHAQTLESILAHIPGVDVLMPSTAGDAAGLLNAAFESGRPTIFLYPKVCLNDRNLATSPDVDKQIVPLGKARRITEGDDLTLVAWGSTVPICRDVVDAIHKQSDKRVDLFDLRSIDPWNRQAISDSVRRTGRLIVVHEDNLTAGFGAEVVAAATEDYLKSGNGHPPALNTPLQARRLTRPDTYVPCNYGNQLEILPSFRRTLTAACDLLELTVTFDDDPGVQASSRMDSDSGPPPTTLKAQGSAPTDQVVTVAEWKVAVGDTVTNGQILADMEADKAVFEYSSPMDGTVTALLADQGDQLDIGQPLIQITPSTQASTRTQSDTDNDDSAEVSGSNPLEAPVVTRPSREDYGNPQIASSRSTERDAAVSGPTSSGRVAPVRVGGRQVRVYLTPVHYAEGSDRLTNADLIRRFPEVTSEDIIKRTGIESRPYCAHNQNALSMAIDAARKALDAEGLTLDDLTGIVCHTTTPPLNTPSMACMVLNALDPEGDRELMVYDVNAACSGWLYALDAAHNTIQHNPDSAVLVVTTECLSRVVNPDDFGTAILFGDAATATVMRGHVETAPGDSASAEMPIPNGSMILSQPVLAGKADPAGTITVGFEGRGHITMQGKRVFSEAVRAMTKMTNQAFERSGAPLDDLDWLVPHQANARILEAARIRLKIPEEKIINLIDTHGNTSSSSIPLAIAKSTDKFKPGNIVGLCAFGGGFTFGAAILEIV
jgi:2-oxoisovalerate dehydrogenase E1 component